MIDFGQIEGFDWDAGNARKSEDKHGVSQPEAEQVFWNTPLIVAIDLQYSSNEPRFNALGKTHDGRRLHITFTFRAGGQMVRVISARDMNRKERKIYEHA